MISLLLAAEGLGALGCGLGAGIAPDKHDSYLCFR